MGRAKIVKYKIIYKIFKPNVLLVCLIQPFFDRLNNQPSSKEILTAEEYEQYIQALLTYETVMAQLGVSSPPKVEMIPTDSQEEFLKAKAVLDYVNDKQMGN